MLIKYINSISDLFYYYSCCYTAAEITVMDELLEEGCSAQSVVLALVDILKSVTATDRVPPGGFHKKPDIFFLYGSMNMLATSSTCDLTLRLPTCHWENDDRFEEYFTLSIKGDLVVHDSYN